MPKIWHRAASLSIAGALSVEFVRITTASAVEIGPAIGTVEAADARHGENLRRQKPCVHAHTVTGRIDGRGMRVAAARLAAMKDEHPVAPDIGVGRAAHLYVARRIVGRHRSQTPADGAVAGHHNVWRVRDFDPHGAAMAGTFDHGGTIARRCCRKLSAV